MCMHSFRLLLLRASAVSETVFMIQRLGGKIDRPPQGAESCAYAHRGAGYWLVMNAGTSKLGKGEDPAMAAAAVEWINSTCQALQPHIINKRGVGSIALVKGPRLDGDYGSDGGALVPMAPVNVFGDAARVEKLRAIKAKYDPGNVFSAVESGISGAHNIMPTAK